MTDDSTTQCLLFPGIFRKPVVARFDQRQGSSDGGALLLKAADILALSRRSMMPGPPSFGAQLMRRSGNNSSFSGSLRPPNWTKY
jgi:hypothetical protein